MLFTMRYRQGSIGVQTAFIEASTERLAYAAGQKWCNQVPNRKFIGVTLSTVASEADLTEEEKAKAAEPSTVDRKTITADDRKIAAKPVTEPPNAVKAAKQSAA